MRLAGCEKSHHSRVDCILVFCALPAALSRIVEQIPRSFERRPSCNSRGVDHARVAGGPVRGVRAHVDRRVERRARTSPIRRPRRRLRGDPLERSVCGTRTAAASADERAPGLRSGGQRAHVRGVQRRRADSRFGPRGLAAPAARRPLHGIARPAALRATSLVSRCARSSSGRSGSRSPGRRLAEAASNRRAGVRLSSGRPLGLVLQPRAILESLSEALEVAAPGGTTSIEIAGGRGSGIRTTRLLAARTARIAGFVPVASSVLIRFPWLRESPGRTTLCVLLDDHSLGERAALAMFLARLGIASARRHVLLRFTRTEAPRPGARWIDTMGIAAMTSMVFVDGDNGPSPEEVVRCGTRGVRAAGPLPRTPARDARRRARGAYRCRARVIAGVRLRQPGSPDLHRAASAGCCATRPYRGARLAARGRHASAVRLLVRASRVLEARGETALAAACAEQPGLDRPRSWPKRVGRSSSSSARGRSPRHVRPRLRAAQVAEATRLFERDRLDAGMTRGVGAVIGIGVVWTDERRLTEAEASLRGACAAADLLGDPEPQEPRLAGAGPLPLLAIALRRGGVALEALVGSARTMRRGHESKHGRSWRARARRWATFGRRSPPRARRSDRAGELDGPASRGRGPPKHGDRSASGGRRGAGPALERARPAELRRPAHLPLAGLRARCLLAVGPRVCADSRARRGGWTPSSGAGAPPDAGTASPGDRGGLLLG